MVAMADRYPILPRRAWIARAQSLNEGNIVVRQHLLQTIRTRIRLVARRRQDLLEHFVYLRHLSTTPTTDLQAAEEELDDARQSLRRLIQQEAYLLRELWVVWGQPVTTEDTDSE